MSSQMEERHARIRDVNAANIIARLITLCFVSTTKRSEARMHAQRTRLKRLSSNSRRRTNRNRAPKIGPAKWQRKKDASAQHACRAAFAGPRTVHGASHRQRASAQNSTAVEARGRGDSITATICTSPGALDPPWAPKVVAPINKGQRLRLLRGKQESRLRTHVKSRMTGAHLGITNYGRGNSS